MQQVWQVSIILSTTTLQLMPLKISSKFLLCYHHGSSSIKTCSISCNRSFYIYKTEKESFLKNHQWQLCGCWCCQVLWSPGRSQTSHGFIDDTWWSHGNYSVADKHIWRISYSPCYLLTPSSRLHRSHVYFLYDILTNKLTLQQILTFLGNHRPRLSQGGLGWTARKSKDQ